MSAPHTGMHWQRDLQPLLDDYLRKIGLHSTQARMRWVAHVLAGLHLHVGEFAEDDIVEQAVEHLRDAIDARLALLVDLDRVHQRHELAAVLAVLQNEEYADLVNALFQDFENTGDPHLQKALRSAILADKPQPVPPDAPLSMPTQTIELRSLRHPFRASR
ncbi:MAG: hypothetical protein R3E64_04625 [Halioglobus sp.]